MVDDRDSPNAIFLHRSDCIGQIIVVTANDDRARHHIINRRSIGISPLGDYFDRQISIGDYSNNLSSLVVAHHGHQPEVFASHHSRGLTNEIAG